VWRKIFIATLVISLFINAGTVLALANISRSFSTTDSSIVPGSLVSAEGNGADTITLANTANSQQLVGVAVPTDQSLLAIDVAANKVQVAVSGATNVLVSTLGGDIKTGDQIAVSPIGGVGMKAGNGMRTVGIAQSDFTSTSAGTATREVADKAGAIKKIYVGLVPVAIVIGYATPQSGAEQGFLGQVGTFASVVAGHSVSTTQSIFSFLVALVAIVALVTLIYGAIHGSLISIGRNPLSRISIYRTLLQIVAMSLLIAVTAIVIVYLILL